MTGWRLLADVGGTNVRFARGGADKTISSQLHYLLSDFAGFNEALGHYLDETGGSEGCHSAAIGAAGAVHEGSVQLTNAPWEIRAKQVSERLGNAPVTLLNDLEAVALALPHLDANEVRPAGGPSFRPSGASRMLAVNVGTGFGAASVFRWKRDWITCPSEAGHMSFAAQDRTELSLVESETGGGTLEDVLSGQGLAELYRRQSVQSGAAARALTATQLFARVDHDEAAKDTVETFTRLLGMAARNLVLATNAWGGVFLTGGVVQGWSDVAPLHLFRQTFEASPKMGKWLRATFTGIIERSDVALFGLAHAAVEPNGD